MQGPEIKLKGVSYRIGRINAIQQFHVSRRVAPILATLGLSLGPELLEHLKDKRGWTVDEVLPSIGPLSHILAGMSDEHVDYVLATCLGAVTRCQPNMGPRNSDLWAPVTAAGGRDMAFEDIDMPTMVRLCIAVMEHNLMDFWKELGEPSNSPSSSPTSGEAAKK